MTQERSWPNRPSSPFPRWRGSSAYRLKTWQRDWVAAGPAGEPQGGSARFAGRDVRYQLADPGRWRMRIDGAGPADGHGDACEIRPARSAADDPRAAGKNRGALAGGEDPSGSRAVILDPALRVEIAAAYRAEVDAVYRQYAITHGDAQVQSLKSRSDEPPRAAPGAGGSAADGRGRQPPPGDVPSCPEGEDPEGVNAGLGELVRVNAKDRAAGAR